MTDLDDVFDEYEKLVRFNNMDLSYNLYSFKVAYPELKHWSNEELLKLWQVRTGGQLRVHINDIDDHDKDLTLKLTQYLFLEGLLERGPDESGMSKVFRLKHANN